MPSREARFWEQRIEGVRGAPSTDSSGVPAAAPGGTIGLRAVRARHPPLHELMTSVAQFFWSGLLTPRDRELISIRVGVLANSPYELYHHHRIGLSSGLSQHELDALSERSLDRWSPRDRAILRAVDELFADNDMADETWSALAELFDDREVIEILYLVGWYWTTSTFANAVRIPIDHEVVPLVES
jgi:alkylhydroperoxidase family enzyme